MHRKVLSQGMCVPNIIGVAQLELELQTIFKNLTQMLKHKRRLWSQGQGNRGKILNVHREVSSQGMCVPNIKGVAQLVLGVMNRNENLNADFKT